MNKVMIVIASVRPVRVGPAVAEWVRSRFAELPDWQIDLVDLAELALPLMDEPNHPRLRQYTKAHTIAWSERVDAADAFVFVTPEYNHSFSPALANALGYLSQEWWRKPVSFVSYGGASAGTRGVVALSGILASLGLVRTGANVEIPFVGGLISEGVLTPTEKEQTILGNAIVELGQLATALRPLQNR
ncbi:MAG: NAD(P)H-dependent oxidoreductase [Microbacteriaceae bacterium]